MPESNQPTKYYYKAKEGHEDRVFINVIRHDNGVIESTEKLESPFLTEVQVKLPEEQAPSTETNNEEQE